MTFPRCIRLNAPVAAALTALTATTLYLAPAAETPVAAAALPALPTSGHVIQRFTAANMAGHFSGGVTAAVQLARSYDVIVALPSQFSAYRSAMKSVNPHLLLLAYLNGTFAQKGQGSAFPASWYLLDARGQRVTSKGWGNYAMNPASPGWIAGRAQACRQMVALGYDGCMLDMLGSEPTQPGYLTGLAIDPATHQPFTAAAWLAAAASLGQQVSQAVAPRIVIGNGLGSGARYFSATAPSAELFTGLRSAIAEAWLKSPGAPANTYPSETVWKQNVDALVNAAARNDVAITITKTWGGGTPGQIAAWHLFSLASYLLGTNGSAYYEFSSANTESGILYDSPWEHLPLGAPLGSYTQIGSVFERAFTAGLAVVNPTATATHITLTPGLCDENGIRQSAVTLGSDGAGVFYRC